jgi:3-oxoadipate enol-lactonase
VTVRLGYKIHGEPGAPALVLGSSLGTTGRIWEPYLPALSEHFLVVTYDHLGHGESAVPDGPYAIAQLASELAATLDHIGIERAHHAGLSLGGMVALHLAATAPDRVDRLAIICSAAQLPPGESWRDRAATVRSTGGTAAIADTVLGRWFTPGFATAPPALACREDLLGTPAEGYAACCEAIAEMDLRPLLGSIRAPTLAITGSDDPATPIEHARTVTEGIRAGGTPADVAVVPGGAHLASVERPEEVRGMLLAHFTP